MSLRSFAVGVRRMGRRVAALSGLGLIRPEAPLARQRSVDVSPEPIRIDRGQPLEPLDQLGRVDPRTPASGLWVLVRLHQDSVGAGPVFAGVVAEPVEQLAYRCRHGTTDALYLFQL